MEVTEHGDLVCSTRDNKIARINVHAGILYFHKSVPRIGYPWGIAIVSDGSILVANKSNKTLSLVSSEGASTQLLWAGLIDTEQEGQLWSVSTYGSVCACATDDDHNNHGDEVDDNDDDDEDDDDDDDDDYG
ncbi:hypothetical protein PoB_005042500 [Plakobranchus ocellatus]|uniref:Bulb-type lectin domain-containing protein n=1 Tax=Plakobranchus ocellatus TaxID=259542 RepID=A0AAV4BTZ1_9GAST|nr:hypothetical protein PoB_005042500 [Plakobranchus ocellatus]